MSDHLSRQLLEGYSRRRLEAAELLVMDDHISTCAACRKRVRQISPGVDALLALRTSLLAADDAAPVHLPPEQLTAYVGGRLDEVDCELAESHLETCSQCTAQAQELRVEATRQVGTVENSSTSTDLRSSSTTLRARLAAALSLSSLRDRFLWLPLTLRVAGTVAVLMLLVMAFALWLRPQKDGRKLVDRSMAPSPSVSPQLLSPSPGLQPPTPAPILLAINDGSGQITLDAQGDFRGMESYSPADQQRVKDALGAQKVWMPPKPKELRGSSGPILGGASGTDLALLSPIGKVVESNRPTFRWRPLGKAIGYQVTLTDPAAGYKEVVSSPQLQEPKWTPGRPLERGRVYNWQIIARTDEGEVKAPGMNEPEARFKVLEQATADELMRAKNAYAGRCLALGLLYARAGLLDEAERELKALAAANPQSPIVKSLLRAVQHNLRVNTRRPRR